MTEPARGTAGGAAPKTVEAGQARAQRRRWLSFGLVGQTAAVVGLIGGIVGLLFTFAPWLRPQPAPQPSAKLELVDVNGRATLREYLSAEGIRTGSLSAAALQRLGVLTTIRYTSSGLGSKELPLVVSLTSRQTGNMVCQHTYRVRAGGGLPLTFRAWSPFPTRPRVPNDSYNLHVTLFPPSGKVPSLDAADHDGIPLPTGVSQAPLPLDLC